MTISEGYELIDYGEQRKLERFGDFVVDRPAPPAGNVKRQLPTRWNAADFRFQLASHHQGVWCSYQNSDVSANWVWKNHLATFQLKLTPFGHIGIFPEQIDNWEWIGSLGKKLANAKILNLFAYTGGTTLALAKCGAEVVHVDSAANVVNWARRNAELSKLGDSRIRWIVEDAKLFLKREIKRGNRYDGFVADPPTFGRGPKRQRWSIESDMSTLIGDMLDLTNHKPVFGLISSHSVGFTSPVIGHMLDDACHNRLKIESIPMTIKTQTNRTLQAGHMARFHDGI